MKKTMKYFSMAALALVGAVMTSCSSDDLTENTQQRVENNGNNIETLTVSVGIGDETRALNPSNGAKTFAVGDKIVVLYKNTNGTTVKAESEPLISTDIIAVNRANFTVTLIDADKTKNVTYIYPAAMVDEDANVKISALASQNGTLASLESNLDYCEFTGAWDNGSLPLGTLDNKLTICAFTLKDCLGANPITSSLTQVTISDGTNNYTIAPPAEATFGDVIYVAMKPVTTATSLELTATDGSIFYAKAVSSRTYPASSFNNLSLRMAEVIKGKFTVDDGKQVYFSKGNLQATGTVGATSTTWTWKFADNQWDKIGGKDQAGSGTKTGNNNISGNGKLSENGTVDLFGWSTDATHLGIHNSTSNSTYSGIFADWGSASEVKNCIGTGWYTLTTDEWRNLLVNRTTASGSGDKAMRFVKAGVNGVYGLIVFPDDWQNSYHPLTSTYINNKDIGFTNVTINSTVWASDFEAHGAVFLPVAGQRHVDNGYVEYPNGRGHYWSSSPNGEGTAFRLYFSGSGTSDYWSYGVGSSRRFGYSVRLVRNVKM